MAETLRELVVALSLDSSNFSRNMRTSTSRSRKPSPPSDSGRACVQNYEKTIADKEAKISMLGQKLTQQQRAVEQYSRALVASNDKLKEKLQPPSGLYTAAGTSQGPSGRPAL